MPTLATQMLLQQHCQTELAVRLSPQNILTVAMSTKHCQLGIRLCSAHSTKAAESNACALTTCRHGDLSGKLKLSDC